MSPDWIGYFLNASRIVSSGIEMKNNTCFHHAIRDSDERFSNTVSSDNKSAEIKYVASTYFTRPLFSNK